MYVNLAFDVNSFHRTYVRTVYIPAGIRSRLFHSGSSNDGRVEDVVFLLALHLLESVCCIPQV